MVVDCAIYDEGQRASKQATFEEALAAAFDLHPLAVEDAVHAHQRPKLERYGESLFMVLKPARYVDSDEVVAVARSWCSPAGTSSSPCATAVTASCARCARSWRTIPSGCRGVRPPCCTPSPTASSTTTTA